MHFLMEAETWVAIAFVIFLGILAYVGVHRTILGTLDKRSARIKAELDEARALRDDAKKLLAEYQNKKGEAEREAQAIIAGAKADAERLAADADVKLQDFITRRTKMAETKIAQAEAQALADVRAAAAEAAVSAAEKVLAQATTGKVADALVTQGIADVQKKLN
jgi:F-type H+-transporting ATPase subunit b